MREPKSYVIHLPMQKMRSTVQKGKEDLLAFINECIDDYYEDGTYDELWAKWIDTSDSEEE